MNSSNSKKLALWWNRLINRNKRNSQSLFISKKGKTPKQFLIILPEHSTESDLAKRFLRSMRNAMGPAGSNQVRLLGLESVGSLVDSSDFHHYIFFTREDLNRWGTPDKELTYGGHSHTYDVIIQAFSPQNQSITRDVWTVYFAAPKSPLNGKYIMLNSTVSEPENIISHLAVPSDIQPSYAPKGKSLIVVTVVGEDAKKRSLLDKKSIEESVLSELSGWFPEQISSWETLDIQYIKSALPELDSTHYDSLKNRNQSQSCGDHTFHGSVEGALISAKYAVEESTKTAL